MISHILPDSPLDAWNLRCRSGAKDQLLVHPSDVVTAVNGSEELEVWGSGGVVCGKVLLNGFRDFGGLFWMGLFLE